MGFLASNFSTSTSWLVIIMIDLEFFLEVYLDYSFLLLPNYFSLNSVAWYDAGIIACIHSNTIHSKKNSVRKGSRSHLHVENSAYQKIEEINDADFCHYDICRFLIVLIISNLLSWDKMFTHTFRVG